MNGGTNLNVSGISLPVYISSSPWLLCFLAFKKKQKGLTAHYFHPIHTPSPDLDIFCFDHGRRFFLLLLLSSFRTALGEQGTHLRSQRNRHAGTRLGRLQISGLLNHFLHIRTIAPMYSKQVGLQLKSWRSETFYQLPKQIHPQSKISMIKGSMITYIEYKQKFHERICHPPLPGIKSRNPPGFWYCVAVSAWRPSLAVPSPSKREVGPAAW